MYHPPSLTLLPIVLKRLWLQILFIALLLASRVVLDFVPEVKEHASVPKTLSFLSVWAVAWAIARSLQLLKEAPRVAPKLAPDVRDVAFTLLRVILYSLAALIALDTLGVSITPLIASLGVGTIAIGLALQDTLGNLFSGVYLYLDRPIAVGDWVRLDTGMEGQVLRIGWRTTRLLSNDHTVVIPNSRLSSAILTNLNLPSREASVTVAMGVGYGSDLEQVERSLLEVGREVLQRYTAAVAVREPVVRYLSFGDSAIQLNLTIRVRTYEDQSLARHELIKAIKVRFDREKIEIPYPQRVIRSLPV
jgi:small-conductance mechanosensitive channel